jgi:hypothetical protein
MQQNLDLPSARPAAPPTEEQRAERADFAVFARRNGEEPILAVKTIDGPSRQIGKIVALAVRDPGVHRITVQMTPSAARELAARLISAAREAE